MGNIFITTLATSLFGALYIKFWKYKHWSDLGLPSIAPSLPFGLANKLIFKSSTLVEQLQLVYNDFKSRKVRHGGIYLFTAPVYIPIDLGIVKKILVDESEVFTERNIYSNKNKDKLFNPMYYADEEKSKIFKQKFSQLLTEENKEIYLQTITKILQNFSENLTHTSQVEFPNILKVLQVKIVRGLFLDEPIFKHKNDILLRKLEDFCSPQENISTEFLLGLICSRILKIFFTRVSHRKSMNYFSSEIEKVVNFRIEQPKKNDFLNVLFEINKNENDVESIMSQVMTFMLAFSKSVSSTVSFCLYELSSNPKLQDKVRKEIVEVLNSHGNISLKMLGDLKFMNQVIKETLRKYPIVPFIKRVNKTDYSVPGSVIFLEKGTHIVIPVSGFHIDEEFFENPQEFNPDRFSEENSSNIKEFTYMPFGAGPRCCIGYEFAIIQIKLILFYFLKNFHFTNVETEKDLEMKTNKVFATPENFLLNVTPT